MQRVASCLGDSLMLKQIMLQQIVLREAALKPAGRRCEQRGFTLPEVPLALSLGSLIMLSAAQLYPLLRSQSQDSAQRFRLEQLFSQVAMGIEKDIRRAGFVRVRAKEKR